MAIKNAKTNSNLDALNIVPFCKITRMEIDYKTDRARLVTIAECPETPKHIADQFRKHNIDSGWVITVTGKELWKLNGDLAIRL